MVTVRVTGAKKLQQAFANAPDELRRRMVDAMNDISDAMSGQSARRTPVDTGLLRSSVAGNIQSYRNVKAFKAEFGTNVRYAIYVHEDPKAHHNVGEHLFMEKGAKASIPYAEKRLRKVMKDLAVYIAT